MKNYKEILKKLDYKIIIIFIILFFICLFQFEQNKKINNLYHSKYYKRMHFNSFDREHFEFEKQIEDEFHKIKRLEEKFDKKAKIKLERNKYYTLDGSKKNPFDRLSFFTKGKIDENNNFILEISMPKEVNNKDIKLDLKDNLLLVSVEKFTTNDNKKKKSKFNRYFSFSRIFTIPNTKANMQDIKTALDNSMFVVTIPIIE